MKAIEKSSDNERVIITYLRVKETKTGRKMSSNAISKKIITYLRVKETKTIHRCTPSQISVLIITYLRVKETKTYNQIRLCTDFLHDHYLSPS